MSRHRNIRKINFDDELSEDVYGRSYDEVDNYCVSPSTEAEFMFKRDNTQHTLSTFMGSDAKIEEEESDEEVIDTYETSDYKRPELNPIDQAKLQSCIEKLEDILGDAYDEKTIVDAVMYHNFDVERSIDQILNKRPVPSSQSSKSSSENKSTPFRNAYYPNKSYLVTTPKSDAKVSSNSRETSPFPKKKTSSGSSTPLTGSSRSQSKEDLLVESNNLNTPTSTTKTPKTIKNREVIDIPSELKKRQDGKELVNLVVIGHVDAGKSTLMGHLLYNLGNVSKKVMHKNETESKKSGKGSFAFAWVLDETEEERARGITMDVAMTMFETKTKLITLMDAPGHRDFIPNMIQGTAQADVAILVVDSRPGEFEAGFEAGGQTREHAILARSLGVAQLVVAINKMDSVDWSKERYDNIVLRLKTFLTRQAGFRESDVFYVPCSGLSGENLTQKATEPVLQQWYKNECLVELIDKFRPPERPIDKPFRLCVSDVYKGPGSFVVSGKIESGCVQNGDRVIAMPAGEAGIIKGLLTRDEPVKFGAAGDHVTASIHGVDMAHVSSGSVICDVENPIKISTKIVARIVVFNTEIPITKGFMIVFHSQSLTEPATISKLQSILNKNSGEVVQKRPRCLTKQMNAVIEIKFSRPICLEVYRENKVLGRFMLRYSGKTIAAGVITEVK